MFHVKQWRVLRHLALCCGEKTSVRTSFRRRRSTIFGLAIWWTAPSCSASPPMGGLGSTLGSGAGFPGLVVAALRDGPVTLIESRRLRVEFLRRAAETLGVNPEIIQATRSVFRRGQFAVISARAFAPLPRLLEIAHRFSTEKTLWLLPKGRGAKSELEAVRDAWQGDFRLEPSLTDADAQIIVATGVRRREGRSQDDPDRRREPERRGGQDDHRDQPRHRLGRDRAQGAADRPRSAGQRLDRTRHRPSAARPVRATSC